ncbi:MAG: hypothetical protein V9H26_10845 [Verrucomicrobiota bacterium]
MSKIRFPLIVCVAVATVASIELAAAADSFDFDYATSYDSVGWSDFSSSEPYKSDYVYDPLSAGSERRLARETVGTPGQSGRALWLPFAVLLLLSWWTNRRSKKPAPRFTD